jgi:hypothetical protein
MMPMPITSMTTVMTMNAKARLGLGTVISGFESGCDVDMAGGFQAGQALDEGNWQFRGVFDFFHHEAG